jgi:hypothetical protein
MAYSARHVLKVFHTIQEHVFIIDDIFIHSAWISLLLLLRMEDVLLKWRPAYSVKGRNVNNDILSMNARFQAMRCTKKEEKE